MHSPFLRVSIVAFLAALMIIPLFFISNLISERRDFSKATVLEIGEEWGGAQEIIGPLLAIPVTQVRETSRSETVRDPETNLLLRDEEGLVVTELVTRTQETGRKTLYLAPRSLEADLDTTAENRHRGIFDVSLFQSNTKIEFGFDFGDFEAGLNDLDRVDWEGVDLILSLSDNRSLRGAASLTGDERPFALTSLDQDWTGDGIQAPIGDPREIETWILQFRHRGAGSLSIGAMGQDTRVTMRGDWSNPSFQGAFSPDEQTLSEDGFTAGWHIPALARSMPEVISRRHPFTDQDDQTFGLSFYQPNDFYQKAYRAARYSVLFIALTFLTVLLVSGVRNERVHPVHYGLIGIAQAIFVLLMVSYAEQIGFAGAYGLATLATVGLITLFSWTALKLGKRSWLVGGLLLGLYAMLFMILQASELALVIGSTLAFCALAGTMILTRNESWGGWGSLDPTTMAKLKIDAGPQDAT